MPPFESSSVATQWRRDRGLGGAGSAPLWLGIAIGAYLFSTQKGVEIALEARVSDAWRVDASYTYLDAIENEQEEVRRPPHIGGVNVAWRGMDPRLGAALTVRYNGSTYDNNYTGVAPRALLGSFTLVNLGGDFKVSDKVQVYGRVENLFDEEYEEVFTYRTPGRAEYLGVRVTF